MNGLFVPGDEIRREQLDWGELGWISRPDITESSHITAMEVTFNPGHGHAFHRHPNQEEVIYVLSGEFEQWLEQERRIMRPGDSLFIAPGVVHASFNDGTEPVRLFVTLGPCDGEEGYVAEDVSTEEPWVSLRGSIQ